LWECLNERTNNHWYFWHRVDFWQSSHSWHLSCRLSTTAIKPNQSSAERSTS
jgi:cell wall assembly regulator SMI1